MRATKTRREAAPVPRPSNRPQTPGLGRRFLHLLALDPKHAGRHVAIGFIAGGLAYALLVPVYAIAGWYHVGQVQLNVGALLWSGLIGTLIYNGLLEEIVLSTLLRPPQDRLALSASFC